MVGYFVICFQQFDSKTKEPFTAEIIQDYGNHWELKFKRKVYKALKAACSTVPFKDAKHARSDEYRAQVAKKHPGHPVGDKENFKDKNLAAEESTEVVEKTATTVESPRKDNTPHRSKSENPRFQRPRHGKNQRPSGSVREKKETRKPSRFSRSS